MNMVFNERARAMRCAPWDRVLALEASKGQSSRDDQMLFAERILPGSASRRRTCAMTTPRIPLRL